MSEAVLTLSFEQPDIAVLTFDDPNKGGNVLSRSVLEELSAHLDRLEKRSDLAGLILRSGKPGSFILGADLREFLADIGAPRAKIVEMATRGRKLFQRLSQCPFVTVAAIDGICVGGGAEMSIWCDRRLMSTDSGAQFGFPEVKLGLFPGWGGTARTPRIVGLFNALEMVTGGDSVDTRAAAAMELVTDVAPAAQIVQAAVRLIRAEQASGQYLRDRKLWSQPIEMSETELEFLGATASAYIQGQTEGKYPAPLAALEVMLGAAGSDLETACQMEAEGMAALFGSPINRALINVFFLSDRNKKDTGVDRPVTPRTIQSVGLIGAGIMGAGIAAANIKRKMPVTIHDAAAEALAVGQQRALEEASYSRELKGPDARKAVELAALLNPASVDAELVSCDLVLEAVVENAGVKKSIYARVEPQLKPDAILASNTSTIPITQLAEGLKRPERFCGIHFFNPVRKMPLVEVIRGKLTSDETIATAVAYAKRIGKSPIVVNDGPGFLVNRLLFPYMYESLELLADGVEVKAIERAARDFGMPMGPLTLYDVVGLDTAFYAGRVMWEAFPDRIGISPIMVALVKAGRYGQKTGTGFFAYKDKQGKGVPDPALKDFVEPYINRDRKVPPDQLTARLFLPMVLEATRAIQEHVVRDVRDVDLGLIYGIGFPPFRGGLLFWADTLGAQKLLEMLKPLEELGARFAPTPLLLEMAKTNKRFYDLVLSPEGPRV